MDEVKKKEKGCGTRLDAAQILTRLAGVVAGGRADILGHEVEFGDRVDCNWEVTVKDGSIHYELSLKIPLVETCDRDGTAGPRSEKFQGQRRGRGKGRYGAKKVKKTTGALWKVVKKAVQDRKPLPQSDEAALLDNFAEYDDFVKQEWREQWEQCVDAARRCMAAVRSGDYETASQLMKEVNDLTKACHKKYK